MTCIHCNEPVKPFAGMDADGVSPVIHARTNRFACAKALDGRVHVAQIETALTFTGAQLKRMEIES